MDYGSVNPNGVETTGWFQIDTTQPTSCSDSFGRKVPAEGVPLGAAFAEVPLTTALTDLVPGTTYYYCAAARSAAGTTYGEPTQVTLPEIATSQGCGCASSTRAAPAWLLGLVLLALHARRRRA